jgi:hypothetical protein
MARRRTPRIDVRENASLLTTEGVFGTGHGASLSRHRNFRNVLWDNSLQRFFVAYVGMVQTRVTLRPGMPCRKMLPVIGLLPKFAEPSVTLLPSELTLAPT